ncbi:hypothetical protein [Chryseobacterium sp. LAM-KRS1]|uniref:hypothetical protein n=1 Tax=Chryseobacterium sp. LAM-KRS1 TaxID=2715754 RepID=UPI001E3838F4|nr:hypothetical protein [Chryseobacterium sp. LAM-KRS1]
MMRNFLVVGIVAMLTNILHAQTDNVFFTNLYAKSTQATPAEQTNYRISNTLTSSGWVLDTNWWGGISFKTQGVIKLKSLWGTLYLSEGGNFGINNESPTEVLDVSGNFKATGDIISAGSNSWVFHSPDDGRKTLHIAPKVNSNYDWGKAFVINGENGNAFIQGKLEAKEVKVTLTPTADFVFDEKYNLPRLEDVEKHIKERKHLPDIASAEKMTKEGVNIGEFQIKLLQKIEELTLYSIEQNKQLKKQAEEIEELKKQFKKKK